MPTPTTPPIEETIRTTVAATLRDAHREGTPVECPHYTGAPGETEAPCEDCDAALVTAAILPLLAPDVRHKPPTGGPVKCLECKACTLPEGHNERCNCSCFTVPDDGPAHKTQAVQP